MSFILDALRKSEHERERRALPGLADAPVVKPAPSKLPLVLGGVGALLAINLVVLVALLARDPQPQALPAADGASTGAAPASAGVREMRPAVRGANDGAGPGGTAAADRAWLPAPAVREVRSLTAEAGATAETEDYPEPPPPARDPSLVPRVTVAPEPLELPRTPAAASGRIGIAGPPAGATGSRSASPASGLPTIHQLAPQATAGLPRLDLNLHVWSAEPAQRFVVVNGTRYREGNRLAEGPALETITPEGVILNHEGLRFVLPRD